MENRKKTKIVCTVSDQRCSVEFIQGLYERGMNVVRINSAHTTLDSSLNIVKNVRKVSDKIAIMIDTKGPEIRLTSQANESSFQINTGETIKICDDPKAISSRDTLYTTYENFVANMSVGTEILIDDGDVSLSVISKDEKTLFCKANNDGVIKGRKSVNVPGVSIELPSVSEKDKSFIIWAVENNIDFVAHSFVRSAKDLEEVQNIIDQHNGQLGIISKIENQEGVDNIDEILEHSYGIMVARGDLGIEIPAERIPLIQKRIVNKCRRRKKPVIVATQMLHTMIANPRPTRAEISDVANAIFEYTDAVMLSGETANGRYPFESVSTMSKIAFEIEKNHAPSLDIELKEISEPISVILAKTMVEASMKLPMKAIIIDTKSGRTGRYVSAFRPNIPVYVRCHSINVMRKMALSYGVFGATVIIHGNSHDEEPVENAPYAAVRERDILHNTKERFFHDTCASLVSRDKVENDDLVGVIAGRFGYHTGASYVEIATVKNLLG
ncbi:MAG: pyruvate kinase [Bacteroidales bacterium]